MSPFNFCIRMFNSFSGLINREQDYSRQTAMLCERNIPFRIYQYPGVCFNKGSLLIMLVEIGSNSLATVVDERYAGFMAA